MVQRIISELYNVSLTPRPVGKGAFTSKNVTKYFADANDKKTFRDNALDGVIEDKSRSTAYPAFKNDEDITNFILFLLRLFDAPPDLRGFLRIEDCYRHILTVFLDKATVNQSLQAQFIAVFDSWLNYLGLQSSYLYCFKQRPLNQNAPIMYFHFFSYRASFLKGLGTYPFYTTYANKFHIAIRDYK